MPTQQSATQALNVHEHMYKRRDIAGETMLAASLDEPPFGAEFKPEEVVDAVRMEVWDSLFSHPSPTDFSLYELYDENDRLVACKKIEVY